MKLLSMTEFVLERSKKSIKEMTILETFKDGAKITNEIFNYANFLNQPIKKGMFVPCDENDNVLEEPMNYKSWEKRETNVPYYLDLRLYYEYQQAQERVLFKGFEFKHHHLSKQSISTIDNILHVFWDTKGYWELSKGISTIEELVKKYNLKK